MVTEFKVTDNNGNVVKAHSAKEAVATFLERFKSRSFCVSEMRDGVSTMVIGAQGIEHTTFYKRLTSRAEARAFAETA